MKIGKFKLRSADPPINSTRAKHRLTPDEHTKTHPRAYTNTQTKGLFALQETAPL